ncbi:hypothetical protein GCM10025858_09110 [Alicyclobacillus sacchari]|uniref:sodium:solute symporter family protein n=1 Tax=Alicyclobacillus sacchari TaxID=392010 RepID=UPI0023E927E1|nr:sodium:solute symporter family protein [Alicyclobacillus sacchari]GMA56408.1 hypothetical protein GCM10025858_09110 [Alicyclobacillus sacchari]
MHALFHASAVDYIIIALYFVFVIGVGFVLRSRVRTGEDFFLSGRSIPAWITGLAFLSANLGALEIMGMTASGAEYGMLTTHFYWIGAIPAMLFLGIYMMPFYYVSKVRSVPEYLKLRYNEATRAVNAIAFAVMTVLTSGISLYSMALIFQILIGWSFTTSILISAVVVLVYVGLGGLTSSIFNEVVQFFLIWAGLLPIPLIGMHSLGGWNGMMARLPQGFGHLWQNLGNPSHNPMGIGWLGVVLGLGFVLSFGYWTTDFLVVQRTLAAKDLRAAQNTPIYAAFFKMIVPILVIIPGLIALAIYPKIGHSPNMSYNLALPLLIAKYYPPGMLGLGLTAMLASFMSGMAGNVTAFTTVWTYDIYQAYIRKDASDRHYVNMGRWAVVVGVIISIGTAYFAAVSQASWTTCRRYSPSSTPRFSARSCLACFGNGRRLGGLLGAYLRYCQCVFDVLLTTGEHVHESRCRELLASLVGLVYHGCRYGTDQPVHQTPPGRRTSRACIWSEQAAGLQRLSLV